MCPPMPGSVINETPEHKAAVGADGFFFFKAPMDSPRAAAMYYVDHVSAGSSCFKLHNATGNKMEPMEIKKSSPN